MWHYNERFGLCPQNLPKVLQAYDGSMYNKHLYNKHLSIITKNNQVATHLQYLQKALTVKKVFQ